MKVDPVSKIMSPETLRSVTFNVVWVNTGPCGSVLAGRVLITRFPVGDESIVTIAPSLVTVARSRYS